MQARHTAHVTLPLVGEVHLPSGFDPLEFAGDTIYGLNELDTGEVTVGTVVLPGGL